MKEKLNANMSGKICLVTGATNGIGKAAAQALAQIGATVVIVGRRRPRPLSLTNLLLDTIKASTPARIINVSSDVHSGGKIDFDNLQGERSYSKFRALWEFQTGEHSVYH